MLACRFPARTVLQGLKQPVGGSSLNQIPAWRYGDKKAFLGQAPLKEETSQVEPRWRKGADKAPPKATFAAKLANIAASAQKRLDDTKEALTKSASNQAQAPNGYTQSLSQGIVAAAQNRLDDASMMTKLAFQVETLQAKASPAKSAPKAASAAKPQAPNGDNQSLSQGIVAAAQKRLDDAKAALAKAPAKSASKAANATKPEAPNGHAQSLSQGFVAAAQKRLVDASMMTKVAQKVETLQAKATPAKSAPKVLSGAKPQAPNGDIQSLSQGIVAAAQKRLDDAKVAPAKAPAKSASKGTIATKPEAPNGYTQSLSQGIVAAAQKRLDDASIMTKLAFQVETLHAKATPAKSAPKAESAAKPQAPNGDNQSVSQRIVAAAQKKLDAAKGLQKKAAL